MAQDMSPPGHTTEEGGVIRQAFTARWGPLPIWVWVAIPAGAYVIYAYWRNRQGGDEEVLDEEAPFDDEYLNVGGYPRLPGYDDLDDGTSNRRRFRPDRYTNAEWMQDAVRWAISQNINSLTATRAVTAYLYKRPPKLNSGELDVLNRIISAKGPAPQGSPLIPPLDRPGDDGPPDDGPRVIPKPPSNVQIRLATGKVQGTWNPSPTPNVVYEVERRLAGAWRLIDRTETRRVQFESAAGKVQIRVRARNPRGFSKYVNSPVLELKRPTEPRERENDRR